MKSGQVAKWRKSIKAAERYQNLLYGKYDSVKLIQWPRFTEDGIYVWQVS